MKKHCAVLAIFLTLGMANVNAQYAQAPDQSPSQYPSQGQQPNPGQQYPADAPPQGNQQYPNQQYPYPSGPYPGQSAPDQNQGPDYQGAPDQNGGQYNQQMPPPPAGQQQNGPQASTSPDAQPGAARVSFIRGDVSTQRGDNGEWIAVTVNTPLVSGDRIATGRDSRAEVQLDYADVLRLSGDSTANLASLGRSNVQVQIGQGVTDFSVLRQGDAQPEIDTPNSAVHPNGPGDYRIVVNSGAESQVIVRSGAADISTPQGSTHVDSGQMITIEGTDNPQYRIDAAPARDDWDSWNNERDHTIEHASSWNQTDPYYVGSEDLDNNGTWSEIPDYGQVWTPATTDPDWAPYRAGRWVYEPYYGWTWVSYEPWGWAPYHYGRWFVYGGNWVWWPGPLGSYPGYDPIWAPAYVSFFGFGAGFGGFGFGRFGWLPCGPGDWYHPWYGGWGGRYGAVGIGFAGSRGGFGPLGRGRQNFSTVGEALRNDRVRGGVSSMAGNEFGRGAVAMHQERMSAAAFRQGSMMTGRMPVTPARASYSPTNHAAGASAIRAGSMGSQHFFSPARNGASSFGRGFNGNAAGRSEAGFGTDRSPGFTPNSRSNEVRSSAGGQSGWQHFNPSSRTYEAQGNGRYGAREPSTGSRAQSYGGYSNSGRPTLNMRQPIVTQRGQSYGGSYNSRSYNSVPSRGAENAPRSFSAPSAGYRGGGSGSSRGGGSGGSSHGGGHGHSGGHH